jgi:hypothetical protein
LNSLTPFVKKPLLCTTNRSPTDSIVHPGKKKRLPLNTDFAMRSLLFTCFFALFGSFVHAQGNCEIFNLTVTNGACGPDSTYAITIDFDVANPTSDFFDLWGNNEFIGTYLVTQLPLTIPNFQYNGGINDVVKVCMKENPNCCRIKEFPVPPCLTQPLPCEIYDLTVTTGECWPDSTYFVTIDFEVENPTNQFFDLWGNGTYIGFFPIAQLPLTLPHFPYDGGTFDFIKVCINDNSNCCRIKEFEVPDCFDQPCNIFDLHVQHTGCLCGKFFAVLTFEHTGSTSGSFDIMGNGVNYGNFPYSQPQPIILGPLEGDNTTMYEFVVKDHEHPGCKDVFEFGKIDCPDSPTLEAVQADGTVRCSPNPATEFLAVTAQMRQGALTGAGAVTVHDVAGRVVRNISVPNAASFTINIGDLPQGTYRLVLDTDLGRLAASFSKK